MVSAATEVRTASLNPDDAITGGGLVNDINAHFLPGKSKFEYFTYPNTNIQIPAAMLRFEDDEGNEYEQAYGAGSTENWAPSEDGHFLIPVGKASALNDNSNLVIFLQNLAGAGFPKDRMTNDISFIDGLYAHVIRIPGPKREGLAPRPSTRANGQERDNTILVVDSIINLPWEPSKRGAAAGGAAAGRPAAAPRAAAAARPRAAAAAPAAAPAPAANGNGAAAATAAAPTAYSAEVDAASRAYLLQKLQEPPFSLEKKPFVSAAFPELATIPDYAPHRQGMVKALWDNDWLTGLENEGLISLSGEGDNVTITAAG